jgi:hypothetical protein
MSTPFMFSTPHSGESLVEEYPIEKWIIWAGAGISRDPPAALPLGFPLTDFALEETCGTKVREKLLAVWKQANEICSEPDWAEPFSWRPRLESVLGGLAELERDAVEPALAFMPGFTSFAEAPPNANHVALASLVLRGAALFTSNFDLCIQEAVRRLTGRTEPFAVYSAGSVVRFRLSPEFGAGEIVHFHGVANDPEYLGATLSRIKEGLPRPFQPLEERLESGGLLLMVGYSVSDSFDVTPYFREQPPRAWPASALVFVQHDGAAAPASLSALRTAFGRSALLPANTGKLIARLAGIASPGHSLPDFDWAAAFRRRLAAAALEGQRAVRTCAVANALGLNVDVLDPHAYARAEASNPGFDPRRYHHLLAIAGRERGAPAKEIEHHRLGGGAESETLGSAYARGRLLSARARAMSPAEILRVARDAKELTWEPYTSMSTHGRVLLAPYLALPWKPPRRTAEVDSIEQLVRVAEALGRRPLRGVLFVRQVATAWRFRLLLNALLRGAPDPGLEREILGLYAELADLAGFVSSYRDFAIVRVLRARYVDHVDRQALLREADAFIRRSAALARVVGDASGRRRARRVRAYLGAVRLFWSCNVWKAAPPIKG